MSADLYDENQTKLREDFLVKFMPEWTSRASKRFSEYELRMLFMLPIKYSNGAVSIKNPTDNNGRARSLGCDCHGGHSYDCNSTNGVLTCKKNSCDGSSWGCGGWWMASCDYVCMRNGVPDQNL